MKNIEIKFILILFLFVLVGCDCEKIESEESFSILEECEDISQLGDVFLIEDSKNFIPYPDNITKVIFTNLEGQEFEGIVTQYETRLGINISSNKPCPIDSLITIQYEWMSENKELTILIDTLNIGIWVRISPKISSEQYSSEKIISDKCSFGVYNSNTSQNDNTQMAFTVNQRNDPNLIESYTEKYPVFEWHGKDYENVYYQEARTEEDFAIYYNSEVGILGINRIDASGNLSLSFERFE